MDMDIFANMCRTCGSDCLEAVNIFDNTTMVMGRSLPITEILMTCLPTSVSMLRLSRDDDYPKQICRVCVKKLLLMYEFQNKWQTANNEFNVALRFEERRNRMTAPADISPGEADTTPGIDDDDAVFALDIDEGTADDIFTPDPRPCVLDSLLSETEYNPIPEVPLSTTTTTFKFPCVLCDERYHTQAAYEKHQKVSHRNCQLKSYKPK